MPIKKNLFTITFGGWYQRTTLHLSEIYDLFALGKSGLNLDKAKLRDFYNNFDFVSVTREWGDLEYIKCLTSEGIEIRYYEDGLYVLETTTLDIKNGQKSLTDYYERCIHPAVSYIFSLGAPTPKILAAIETTHPVVVSAQSDSPKTVIDKFDFGPIYNQINSKKLTVFKTPKYIVLVTPLSEKHLHDLIEMQIFFREFKDQLQTYLDIHREVWEEISEIKEKGVIQGKDVEAIRSRLDSLQKTISLIKSRINQMGSYVRTRASIARKLEIEDQLSSIFQYKYETLIDTHNYIQEIWKMTQDYIDTAIQVVVEVKNQSTNNSIQSLRLITTIGVLSGIFGYLSKDEFPTVTLVGVWYFFVLIVGTWLIDQTIGLVYQNIKYKLKFTQKIGIK